MDAADDWSKSLHPARQELRLEKYIMVNSTSRTSKENVPDKQWWKGLELIGNDLAFVCSPLLVIACSPMVGTPSRTNPATVDVEDDSVQYAIEPPFISGFSGDKDCHNSTAFAGYLPNCKISKSGGRAIFNEAEGGGKVTFMDNEPEMPRLLSSRQKKKVKKSRNTATAPGSLLEVARTSNLPVIHDQLHRQAADTVASPDADACTSSVASQVNPSGSHHPVILVDRDPPEDTSTLDTRTVDHEVEHSAGFVDDDSSDHSWEIRNLVRQTKVSSAPAPHFAAMKNGDNEGGVLAITDHGSNGSSITTMNYHLTNIPHGPMQQHVFRPVQQDVIEELNKFADLRIMSSEHRWSLGNEEQQYSAVSRYDADNGASTPSLLAAMGDDRVRKTITRDKSKERRRRSLSSSSSKQKKSRSPAKTVGNRSRNSTNRHNSVKRRGGSTPTQSEEAPKDLFSSTSQEVAADPSILKRKISISENDSAMDRFETNAVKTNTLRQNMLIPQRSDEIMVENGQWTGFEASNSTSPDNVNMSQILLPTFDNNDVTSSKKDRREDEDEDSHRGPSEQTTTRVNVEALQDRRNSIDHPLGHPHQFEQSNFTRSRVIASSSSAHVGINRNMSSSPSEVYPINAEELYMEYHKTKKLRDIQEMKKILQTRSQRHSSRN